MKLVFGEKVAPEPVRRGNDADNLWGPSWHAWRTADGFALEYDTGDLGGRERRFAITAEEWERLRADPDQFKPIVYAHGG